MGDIADEDGSAVDYLDWGVIQFVDFVRAAVDLDVVLKLPHLGSARWQNQVLIADCVGHVGRRQSLRLQRLRIQVYLDLALLTPVGVRNCRAFDRNQLRTKKILSQIIELLLGEPLPRQGQLQDRNAGCVVGDNQRRRCPLRQLPQLGLRNSRHLRDRSTDVRVRLKENLHNGDAVQRLRFDVFNVIDSRAQRALCNGYDPALTSGRQRARHIATQY